ncbi:DUF1800 domain-containing protein [Nocardioides mangrovicus]|nr:DUF1800 domain-containing protein [Nocardioides mangrovicus]
MIVRARSATLTAERPAATAVAAGLPDQERRGKKKHATKKKPHRRHVLATAAAQTVNVVSAPASSIVTTLTGDTGTTDSSASTARRLSWASTAVPTAAELHVISRFSFGFTQAEFTRLRARNGASGWLEQQLRPDTIPDPVMDELLAALPDLYLPAQDQAAAGNTDRKSASDVQRQHFAATVARRAFSTRQLEAVMEDFWTNHFYIPCTTVSTIYYHADYCRTLRQNALGRFEDLLIAAETHPAMLTYLSTVNSEASHPNENQGREMFELHTVGLRNGYTENDIDDVSKLLTGWTTDRWAVSYEPDNHATGAVSAMGWSDPNSDPDGRAAYRSLLSYLAHHPNTASYVCRKLAVRFVSDSPSDSLVAQLAQTYLNNDTQIAPVLRALARSPEFLRAAGQKLRTPAEDCVATLRATGVTVPPLPAIGVDSHTSFLNLASLPRAAGQPLFSRATPDGFPDVAAAWSTSVRATAMLRWHWQIADPDSGLVGDDSDRPSVSSLLPRSSMRFDQWVDHLCRTLLGLPADDVQVAAACAATGLSNSTTVTASSTVAGSGFQRLLVSLLDTPTLLNR